MSITVNNLTNLWQEAYIIWISGGWAMFALAFNALMLFGLGTHIYLQLKAKGMLTLSRKIVDRWISTPGLRRGTIGELLDVGTETASIKDCMISFEYFRAHEIVSFDRDLKVMKICIAAAPLLGLLGTVTGMLATFNALATGSGGEKTMGMVAKGISEALITTETGLVIALPGLFFQYQLTRSYEKFKGLLAHLETVCTQNIYKNMCKKKHDCKC